MRDGRFRETTLAQIVMRRCDTFRTAMDLLQPGFRDGGGGQATAWHPQSGASENKNDKKETDYGTW